MKLEELHEQKMGVLEAVERPVPVFVSLLVTAIYSL